MFQPFLTVFLAICQKCVLKILLVDINQQTSHDLTVCKMIIVIVYITKTMV